MRLANINTSYLSIIFHPSWPPFFEPNMPRYIELHNIHMKQSALIVVVFELQIRLAGYSRFEDQNYSKLIIINEVQFESKYHDENIICGNLVF